jgi:type IV pilus assembly protein PilE
MPRVSPPRPGRCSGPQPQSPARRRVVGHGRGRGPRGFTLLEVLTVCAVAGVLAAVALPSYQAQRRQAQRSDAVTALMRLQQAQEQYRAHHGMYADALPALHGVPQGRSEQGHYRLVMERTEGEVYTARAEALPDGLQAADTACAVLTLQVQSGFAQTGPSARCWNR